MSRKVCKYCGSCHKPILEGEEYVLEGDLRGVLKKIYHKRCVQVKTATDRAKIIGTVPVKSKEIELIPISA